MDIKRPEPHMHRPADARRVFKGVIFDTYHWEQEVFDGSKHTWENLSRPDTVEVFPVLPDGRILLISQQQPSTKVYMSTIAGRMEEGEDPLDAMKRELLEETGYEVESWTLWDARQPAHKIDWAVYTFIAKGLKKVAEQDLDGGEKIELMHVTFDEMLELAVEHNLVGGKAFAQLCEARGDVTKKAELKKMFSPN
jgi:ADP-ribose pyrophosphatase